MPSGRLKKKNKNEKGVDVNKICNFLACAVNVLKGIQKLC
jgi:hypothetical protein